MAGFECHVYVCVLTQTILPVNESSTTYNKFDYENINDKIKIGEYKLFFIIYVEGWYHYFQETTRLIFKQ